MKNFKLLLATAVLFAVGSAFTASNKVAGEYILQGSTYVLKSTQNGHCDASQNSICDYTKINPSGSNTNPANFTPNRMNEKWVSD